MGVQSDSMGWVGLLGGSGTISEQGTVVARSHNVVRMTGATWMDKSNADASMMISEMLQSGTLVLVTSASAATTAPLAQLNQRLAQGWNQADPAATTSTDVLASKATVLSTKSRASLHVDAPSAATAATFSVLASPQTTAKLLEVAMTVTQQGNQLRLTDNESMGTWVNRTSLTVNAIESNSTPAPAVYAPTSPVVTQPASPPLSPSPATPPPPAAPGQTTPTEPSEPSTNSPASDVRWLLPLNDGQASSSAGDVDDERQANFLGGMTSGLRGAVLKVSQWIGWDLGLSARVPASDKSDSTSSSSQDAGKGDKSDA
jgi:hypothetical protein